MPGPIQTLPQGLLGLLQLKQSGQNPTDLLTTVSPAVDMTQWWLQRNDIDICLSLGGLTTFTAGVNAVGVFGPSSGALTLSVPNEETWWVSNYTLIAQCLATEDLVLSGAFTFPASASAVYELGPAFVEPTDATARARQVSWSARGFWLYPGAKLQAVVHDVKTAGTINIGAGLRGARIPV